MNLKHFAMIISAILVCTQAGANPQPSPHRQMSLAESQALDTKNQIQSNTAGGEGQVTVIDEGGNLKMVPGSQEEQSSTQLTPAKSVSPPSSTTTPGMTGSSPAPGQLVPTPKAGVLPAPSPTGPSKTLPSTTTPSTAPMSSTTLPASSSIEATPKVPAPLTGMPKSDNTVPPLSTTFPSSSDKVATPGTTVPTPSTTVPQRLNTLPTVTTPANGAESTTNGKQNSGH